MNAADIALEVQARGGCNAAAFIHPSIMFSPISAQ